MARGNGPSGNGPSGNGRESSARGGGAAGDGGTGAAGQGCATPRALVDWTGLDWIGVDWGTSHLRAWAIDGEGRVLARRDSGAGMGTLAPEGFEGALLDLIGDALPAAGRVPVLCCGMAGSRQGWAEAPYMAVPCAPPSAAQAARGPARDPRLDVRLLPGLKQARPADVMRGEETQIAGALAAEPRFDGVICLPGTHTKWAQVSAGEVVSFRTFLTGEMFALLSGQSVLRHTVAAEGWDGAAFAEALAEGMAHPARLGADLFGLRAAALLEGLDPVVARARLSGLLVGMELAAARPYWLGQDVAIVGTGGAARAYAQALQLQGAASRTLDAEAVTLAGLAAARLGARTGVS
ncbi:2-keto-3-deoxy-galactonokinase [Rhodovulum sp. 12E13]|uniref:2-dehydro-3-deoxygalactonokinase n=1 Tax=Rhodovulum sp. 12E13 TaxID=2203891 RepID=UPI000E14F113|nr:2-dehydro-3-deoxygalactonokinase [Rhodovulum sp. 12E13]RDC69874.1 2-keto-3-deoxy-galactonokinase [Rhodovulum sp. 12E13]